MILFCNSNLNISQVLNWCASKVSRFSCHVSGKSVPSLQSVPILYCTVRDRLRISPFSEESDFGSPEFDYVARRRTNQRAESESRASLRN